MKTKQLANVLIKILGLSLLVHSIPGFITGLVEAVKMNNSMRAGLYNVPGNFSFWSYPPIVSSLVLAAIGIYLVIQSRKVTELLFKGDDE